MAHPKNHFVPIYLPSTSWTGLKYPPDPYYKFFGAGGRKNYHKIYVFLYINGFLKFFFDPRPYMAQGGPFLGGGTTVMDKIESVKWPFYEQNCLFGNILHNILHTQNHLCLN